MKSVFINILQESGPFHIVELKVPIQSSYENPITLQAICGVVGKTLNRNSHFATEECHICYEKWREIERLRSVTNKLVTA